MAGMASPCNAQEVVLQLQSDRQSKPTMEKSLLKSSMLSSGLSQIDPEMATISQEIDNMRTGAAKMAHAMQEKIRQIIAKNCMYAEADNRLQTNVRDMEKYVTDIHEALLQCEKEIGTLRTLNTELKSENKRLTSQNTVYERELRQKKEGMKAACETLHSIFCCSKFDVSRT